MNDIAAMKLLAIKDNGSRLKDFIDVAFLSTRMPLIEMLKSFHEKYPSSNAAAVLKALTYFEDIDFNVRIALLGGRYEWRSVSKRLYDMCTNKDKVFDIPPYPAGKS